MKEALSWWTSTPTVIKELLCASVYGYEADHRFLTDYQIKEIYIQKKL